MNLFSFFRKTEKTGAESAVDSKELIDNRSNETEEEEVITELSFHPEWMIPQEQQYVFRFLANELEPLKPYQLSLSGIDIDVEEANGNWLVKAFFRSSVPEEITMGNIELLLTDKDGKLCASKNFDFNELGKLPSNSARPWVFVFEKDFQKSEEQPDEGWTLNFNIQSLVPHSLDLDPVWEKSLDAGQKEGLKQLVDNLPKLKPSEVNFTGFQTHFKKDGSLDVAILIRNGHTRSVNLEKLPLEIVDATGQVVCKGTFNLPPLTIKANSSKPWTFTFPKQVITVKKPDFSRWSARVPQ